MGALAALGSPFTSGALASFQPQQLHIKNHRLKEDGDCYLVIHAHQGNWVEVLVDYGLHLLRLAFSVNSGSQQRYGRGVICPDRTEACEQITLCFLHLLPTCRVECELYHPLLSCDLQKLTCWSRSVSFTLKFTDQVFWHKNMWLGTEF